MESITKNRRSIRKLILVTLVLIVAITGLFSVTASAAVPFLQSGDVVAYGTYCGGEFNSGVDNRLTVNARALVKAGNPSSVKLTLQKYGTYGWGTVAISSIPCDNIVRTIWRDVVISQNTNYRILCSIESGGADVATVYIAISPWESVS